MWPFIDALLPIIALTGVTGGGIWFSGMIWEWWPPRRLSVRFEEMAPRIDAVRSELKWYRYGEDDPNILTVLMDDLWIQFRIRKPDLMTLEEWKDFLFALYRTARLGKVQEARKLTPND